MKKVLSLFLALVMVLSVLVSFAFGAETGCTGAACAHLADLNGAHYDTLQDAVDAAQSGDTVTLLKDIVLARSDIESSTRLVKLYGNTDGAPNLGAGSNLTLDLGGHTLRFAEDVKDSTCNGFRFIDNWFVDLTIQNGTFDLTNDTKGVCNAICAFDKAETKGTITRLDVNFIVNPCTQICFSNGGHVYINGGTYTLTDDTYENYPYVGIGFYKTLLNTSNGTPFTINGGTFVNFDPLCQCKLAHYTDSGLGDGKVMFKNGGVFTIGNAAEAEYTYNETVICWKDWGRDGTKVRTYAYKSPVNVGMLLPGIFEAAANVLDETFADVSRGAYYYNAVQWAAERGIAGGVDKKHFAPDESCTRAQAVTMLWRAAGCPAVWTENPFEDVDADDYYYEAVLWAVANGITSGADETHFSPDAPCTRGQIVTFLHRAARCYDAHDDFGFADVKTGSYCEDAINWAVENAITNGTDVGVFSPDDTCTRSQIVTFLYRNR